jgi:hypothetical protein
MRRLRAGVAAATGTGSARVSGAGTIEDCAAGATSRCPAGVCGIGCDTCVPGTLDSEDVSAPTAAWGSVAGAGVSAWRAGWV